MTRELAIDILTGNVIGTTEQTHEAVKMATEALSDVPDIHVGKWISCSERLPAENGNYLVTAIWRGKLDVDMDYFQFGCMWDDYGDNVIAWMPLPEPYKEGDTK